MAVMVSALHAQLVLIAMQLVQQLASSALQVPSKTLLVLLPALHAQLVPMQLATVHKYVLHAYKVHTPLVYSKWVTM